MRPHAYYLPNYMFYFFPLDKRMVKIKIYPQNKIRKKRKKREREREEITKELSNKEFQN